MRRTGRKSACCMASCSATAAMYSARTCDRFLRLNWACSCEGGGAGGVRVGGGERDSERDGPVSRDHGPKTKWGPCSSSTRTENLAAIASRANSRNGPAVARTLSSWRACASRGRCARGVRTLARGRGHWKCTALRTTSMVFSEEAAIWPRRLFTSILIAKRRSLTPGSVDVVTWATRVRRACNGISAQQRLSVRNKRKTTEADGRARLTDLECRTHLLRLGLRS